MSRVMKKLASRRASKQGKSKTEDGGSECSSPLTSPVSVASNEIFQRRGSYDKGLIAPYSDDGDLRGESAASMNFDDSGFDMTMEDFSETEQVSEGGDNMDFGESFFDDKAQADFKSSVGSSSKKSSSKKRSSKAEAKNSKAYQQRAMSVQRPMQESSIEIIERADDLLNKSRRRSKSTGRSTRREQMSASTLKNYKSKDDSESPPKKERKSKMEKILQLQEKNQRYKDEFRKVQKDRKALKKELEHKKLETAALTKEIDTHMSETSLLKLKLSEALQQLDRTDHDERKDKSAIQKLQKELTAARGDYNAAIGRVARMREEVEAMKVSVARKDEQIKALTAEVAEQSALVDSLHMETVSMRKNHLSEEKVAELREENRKLNQQLGETLQNAANMVKEREDAIADLLRENEEMKRLVHENQEQPNDQSDDGSADHEDVSQEEIAQLRSELESAAAALEESQDRTVLLEEEIEAWIARGQEMETELERLRDDVEAWQSKAESAEETITVVEASARESAKKVVMTETAFAEAERRFKEQLQEQERRHQEALWKLKDSTEKKVAEAEKANRVNPQDEALRLAMAKKEAKNSNSGSGGSWGLISQLRKGNSEDQEDATEEQKRIKELERDNEDQATELKKAKSDLVQLMSTHRETKYTNEKRIEQLMEQNNAYAAKQKAMELEIAALRQAMSERAPDLTSDSSHSMGSF